MSIKRKILLVEDDTNLGNLLQDSLEMKNFDVTLKRNGEEALQEFKANKYDMCILDVMLPKKDGFTLAKDIRRINSTVPIIFLTAKALKEDTIEGLRIGADDYITKPFSMEELNLRIDNIFKRLPKAEISNQNQFHIGNFYFDNTQRLLKIGDKETKLTTKESELLKMLALYQDRVLEREVALNSVWGTDSYFAGRSMDVYIAKLRKLLRDDPNVEILNIHGTGFKLIVKK
ncbi:MAG: response regulator transcription factor [Chitinophagales bacterium]|nr:response regulator transcription factor [Chitinophagales bacterium]MDW8420192.1 response regulator transcription factor [Chitinophagales bacterium]